jgi:hypothetical protein
MIDVALAQVSDILQSPETYRLQIEKSIQKSEDK